MIFPSWFQELSRADFLKSVGLYVASDRVTLVRMRKSFHRLSLIEAETREIQPAGTPDKASSLTGWSPGESGETLHAGEQASRLLALREAIRSLLPHFEPADEPIFVCLSPEQFVVHRILLPVAAEENLPQVLEYEIQRLLPFRLDGLYYDYLSVGKSKDRIELLLFAVPKNVANEILDVLAAFGIKPHGVEATITAMANYFHFCAGASATGPALILGEHSQGCEIVGVHTDGNGWRPGHGIRFAYWMPRADWMQGPGKEIFEGCLVGSPKIFRWGAVEEFLVSMRGDTIETEDLWALGNEKLIGEEKIPAPFFLPAVGAALRGLRASTSPGNFLPGAEETLSRSPLSWQNLSLTFLLLFALIVLGVSYPIKDEIRLRRVQKEMEKIRPSVESLRREEEELRKVTQEINTIADLVGRRGETIQILDELSRIVPTSAYISNLQYRNQALELQGSAESASNLVPILERSPLFKDVGFNAPSTRRRDDRETFSLKAGLERAGNGAGSP